MQSEGMSWMMLERFVFRRDDVEFFPEEATAPMRAKSWTSLGGSFTVALLPADPPAVSRLYVQWPRGSGETVDPEDKVTEVLTAHGRLFLLRTTSRLMVDKTPYRQDYFVFQAGSGRGTSKAGSVGGTSKAGRGGGTSTAGRGGVTSWLKRLPPCTEPIVLSLHGMDTAVDRWFDADTVGLVRGRNDQYAVVQLAKFFEIPLTTRKMGAELCVFSPPLSSSRGVVAEGKWNVLKLQICHSEEEFSDLQGWSTDRTFTFNNSIYWVDYHHGGVLSYIPTPVAATDVGKRIISYIRLPIDNRPNNSLPSQYPLEMYRSLCVTSQKGKEQLMFVDVARNDDAFFGLIREGCSFTITCYTSMPTYDEKWHKDVTITSRELWHPESYKSVIPQYAFPMFPVVSRDKPHLVHFLMSEPSNKIDKVSMVDIDIIKKKAVSVRTFIEGEQDLYGQDEDMVSHWSRLPRSFLPVSYI